MQTDVKTPVKLPLQKRPIGRYVRFPIQRIHLELTNVCNFDCTFCPKSVMTRKYGYMETALAKKIIDQIIENRIAEKITFHIMGEPFLHRDFFEILDYCHKRSLPTGITTNGSFLNPETAQRLAPLGVSQMNISLQTPDEVSFKAREAGKLRFHPYEKNITGFIDTLRRAASETAIKIHFLNTRFGSSVKDAIGGLEVIGSTAELRNVLSQWTRKIYGLESFCKETESMEKALKGIASVKSHQWNVLEIAPDVFLETYVLDNWGNAFGNGNIVDSVRGYCPALTDHFGILHTGDFVLCCKDFDGKTKMGSVKEKTIAEILNSEPVLNVVREFSKWRVVHPHCKTCMGGSTWWSAKMKTLGSIFFFDLFKGYFYKKQRLY